MVINQGIAVKYPTHKKKPARVSEATIALTPPATIQAGEFKAKCLELMDQVQEHLREIVITKHGKPVAKLVPVTPATSTPAFGALKGSVLWYGDLISPIDAEWEVERA